MKIAKIFYPGLKDMPLLIFIHGMGMDMSIWSSPEEARILGGLHPLSALFHASDHDMNTLFGDFRQLGFSVLSWSQSRPVGPLQIAVGELDALIREYGSGASAGVVLIGHSRGGLIGRRYVERNGEAVKGLITIGTPHHGSLMAKWSVHLSPVASALQKLLREDSKGLKKAFRRILGFFGSEGIRELLPDSPLYSELKSTGRKAIRYMSVGGTNPDLIKIGNVSIIELMSKIIPEKVVPEEMKAGYGDGLVSAESSVLPYGSYHRNFHCNHLSLLFDKALKDLVISEVEKMSTSAAQ